MNENEVREQLRQIICEVAEIDEIEDSALFKDVGIDSMMAIEIVADVERTFQISIPEDELQTLTNLEAVFAKVRERLAA